MADAPSEAGLVTPRTGAQHAAIPNARSMAGGPKTVLQSSPSLPFPPRSSTLARTPGPAVKAPLRRPAGGPDHRRGAALPLSHEGEEPPSGVRQNVGDLQVEGEIPDGYHQENRHHHRHQASR